MNNRSIKHNTEREKNNNKCTELNEADEVKERADSFECKCLIEE